MKTAAAVLVAAVAALSIAAAAHAATSAPALTQLKGEAPLPVVAAPKGAPAKPAKSAEPANVGACTVDMRYETITAGPIIFPVQGVVTIKGTATMTCAVSETQSKTIKATVTGEGIAPGFRIPPFWSTVRADGTKRVWRAPDPYGNQLVYVSTRYASKGLQLPTPYRFIHGKESTASYYSAGGSAAVFRLEVSPGVNRNVELSGDFGVAQEFDFSIAVSMTQFKFTQAQ
jgi:hypothetical protein